MAPAPNSAVITPDWSPDGKHLVFCTVIEPNADDDEALVQQADVWIVTADGSDRANLTHSRFVNLQPVWSRTGTIYFVANRGRSGQENIWAIQPDGALRLVRHARTSLEAVADTAEGP